MSQIDVKILGAIQTAGFKSSLISGESYNNIHGRIGGDSELSPRGEKFADKLAEFVKSISEDNPDVKIWTSWMKRTIDTACKIDGVQER